MSKQTEKHMTSTPEADQTAGRRSFLKLAGLGALAGGSALAAGQDAQAAQTDLPGSGYRETEHVKTYYDLTRF